MTCTADDTARFRHAFLRHQPQRVAVMQPERSDTKYISHQHPISDDQIATHLAGRAAYATPAAHAGLAHLLPLDIDAGGMPAAQALLDAATRRGLFAFGQVDPERDRGYVWLPFNNLTNTQRIHTLGDALIAEVAQPTWRIENRATEADTRLPFARHAWTHRRGVLLDQDGTLLNLDQCDDLNALLDDFFVARYQENAVDQLPPLPEPAPAPARRPALPSEGVTIADYNASTDLAALLDRYGAKPSRTHPRLYHCPFHDDSHASLLVSRDGQRCHCLSQHSDCPLSGRQHDAFNVFCLQHHLNPNDSTDIRAALRQLNHQEQHNDQSQTARVSQSPSQRSPDATRRCRNTLPSGHLRPNRLWLDRGTNTGSDNAAGWLSTPSQVPQPTDNEALTDDSAVPHQSQEIRRKSPPRPDKGLIIWEVTAARIGPHAALVMQVILEHCNPYGYIRLSNQQYQEYTGLSRRTVQKYLDAFCKYGFLRENARGRSRQTNEYLVQGFYDQAAPAPVPGQIIEASNVERGVQLVAPPPDVVEDPARASDQAATGDTPEQIVENSTIEIRVQLVAPTCNHDHVPTPTPDDSLAGKAAHRSARAAPPAPVVVEGAATGDLVAGGDDLVVTGPAGAIAYPAGAAYVPPEAEAWYESVLPQLRPVRAAPEPLPDLPEPVQVCLEPEQSPAPPPQPRRRRQACSDPNKLRSRIIAAERKVAKLEREGGAQNRKQARAIRHATAKLKARLAMLEESWYCPGAEEPPPVEAPATVEQPALPASALVEPEERSGPLVEAAPAERDAPLPASPAAGAHSRMDWLTDLWQDLHEYQARQAEARGDLAHARFLRESAGLPMPEPLALLEARDVAVGHIDAIVPELPRELAPRVRLAEARVHAPEEEVFREAGAEAVDALRGDAEFGTARADGLAQAQTDRVATGPQPVTPLRDGVDGGAEVGMARVVEAWPDGALPPALAAGDEDLPGLTVDVRLLELGDLAPAQAAGGEQVEHTEHFGAVNLGADIGAQLGDVLRSVAAPGGAAGEIAIECVGDEFQRGKRVPLALVQADGEFAERRKGGFDVGATDAPLVHQRDPALDVFGAEVAEHAGFLRAQTVEQGQTALAVGVAGGVAEHLAPGCPGALGLVAALAFLEHSFEDAVNLVGDGGATAHMLPLSPVPGQWRGRVARRRGNSLRLFPRPPPAGGSPAAFSLMETRPGRTHRW